jgi:hypothetical protein
MNVHHRSALVALSAVLALIAAALVVPAAAWPLMAISSTPPTPPRGGLASPIALDKPASGAFTVRPPTPVIPPSLPNQSNPHSPSTQSTQSTTTYSYEKLKHDAREVLAFLYTHLLTLILCNLDGDEDPDDDDDDDDDNEHLPNPNNAAPPIPHPGQRPHPHPRDPNPLPDFYARILPRLLFGYFTLSGGGACLFWNNIPGDLVGRVRCALHLLAVVEAADREAAMPRWVRGGMGCAQRVGRAWGLYLAVEGAGGRPGLVRVLAAGMDLAWFLREDLWWFGGWLGEVWEGGGWGLL